jgi:hypothetical protein
MTFRFLGNHPIGGTYLRYSTMHDQAMSEGTLLRNPSGSTAHDKHTGNGVGLPHSLQFASSRFNGDFSNEII